MEDRVRESKEKRSLKYKVNSFINRSGIKAGLTGADTLHPEIKLIYENRQPVWKKYVELTTRRISCWTINNEADFRNALSIGTDIVISGNPEQAVGYRFRLQNHATA